MGVGYIQASLVERVGWEIHERDAVKGLEVPGCSVTVVPSSPRGLASVAGPGKCCVFAIKMPLLMTHHQCPGRKCD